ncbi:hypothetical protein OSTOST_00265, partial [Ostertagia ostertagi]
MDGNRIWNKELPGTIAACEWSPDGNLLLFGMGDGEVHTYDSQGNFAQKLHMVALESVELETALAKDLRKDNIIALKWYAPTPKSRFLEIGECWPLVMRTVFELTSVFKIRFYRWSL